MTFPQFPIGCGGSPAAVTNPQLNIKPPNSAIVEPSHCPAEPEAIADFIDMAQVVFIPIEDVRVVLQRAGDTNDHQWLAITYDCVQVIGEACGEVGVSIEEATGRAYKARMQINGPRPSSCNTNMNSDRLVTPTIEE